MFLKIKVNLLSANDADYFLRELTEKGAEGKIIFNGMFRNSVVVTQKGQIEDLLKTMEVVYFADSFHIDLSGWETKKAAAMVALIRHCWHSSIIIHAVLLYHKKLPEGSFLHFTDDDL